MSNSNLPAKRGGYGLVGDEPWSDEIRELAFELWYFKFHRNMASVLDYLNSIPDQDDDLPGDDLIIDNRDVIYQELSKRPMKMATLYAWRRRMKWDEMAEARHRSIAPALYARVDHQLDIASIDAAQTLIDLLHRPDVNPKTKLEAANSILDRTGHTAWVRPSDDGKITGPQRDYSGTVAGKSIEELMLQALGEGSDE